MKWKSQDEKLLAHGDDELNDEEEFEDADEDDEENNEVYVSFACEDCDYRWEILLDEDEDDLERVQYCPMCGSTNTTQI